MDTIISTIGVTIATLLISVSSFINQGIESENAFARSHRNNKSNSYIIVNNQQLRHA